MTSLFYLLLGTWTRSAAGSFRRIVTTQGGDVRNLMDGMASLHRMYSLLYVLLLLILLSGIVALGLTVWRHFAA